MKKIVVLLLVGIAAAGIVKSQNMTNTFSAVITQQELDLVTATDRYLQSAFWYNLSADFLILSGSATFLANTWNQGELEVSGAIGFFIGFGGTELLKFSAIPQVKARRNLVTLRPLFTDTASYQHIFRQVKTAETLSKATIACMFIGQAMAIIGLLQNTNTGFKVFVTTGLTIVGLGVGTSLASAVFTQKARISFGKATGFIGLSVTPDGVGARYCFR